MAPQYKLTYFNVRALAEPIRYILSYGGADFEDVRIEKDKWPEMKPTIPFGKLPVLEVGGKKISQSIAICRYLAKKFNLMPKDDWAQLECDAIVDSLVDLRTQVAQYMHETDEEKKEKLGETLKKETMPFYLSKFDEVIKKNGGYLVGGALTWADLYFTAIFELFEAKMEPELMSKYTNLTGLFKKVKGLPAISAWIKKRPVTEV